MIRRHPVVVLTAILALQAALLPRLQLEERQVQVPRLELLPASAGDWTVAEELPLDAALLAYLQPDGVTVRNYTGPAPTPPVNLVVAYFKSLQGTHAPHSPRHCLPGAGWNVISSSTLASFPYGARGQTAGPINLHLLERGKDRMVVVYWYQNARRVWASEFLGKLHLLPDLIRYRQADAALVRITMLVPAANAEVAARSPELASLRFAGAIFPQLVERFAEAAD